MNNKAILYYQEKLASVLKNVEKYNQVNIIFSVLKLFSFIAAIIVLVYGFYSQGFNIAFIFVFPVIFILLVIFNQKYLRLYSYYKSSANYIQDEISFYHKDFSVFRPCEENINPSHDFSYDLDIFEKGSLFHSLNRCSTLEGETLLKTKILNPAGNKSHILKYQQAVQELISMRDLSCDISSISYNAPSSLNSFINSIEKKDNIKVNKVKLIPAYISAVITIGATILYAFNVLPSVVPLGLFIMQFLASSIFTKKANDSYGKLNKANKAATTYLQICKSVLQYNFKSEFLIEIKENLTHMYKGIYQLQKINAEFDQRNSGLYFLLSNGFLLKDIFLLNKVNKWILENSQYINKWSDTIAHIDVINSISTYAYINNDFIFPIMDNNTIIKAENLSHPSINIEKRIGNTIEISKTHNFLIITGANMAGKSTFIRSIGINLILASLGAPVCAKSFYFQPVSMFSSMRTSDKLMESSSYFHAELQRLKLLKEKASQGETILILLDEILKGTNSQDKLKGSKLVLLKFIEYNMAGILATHDTALGSLEKEYPDNFRNYYFDFNLDENGEMIFDYKLKKGISQNMNASILIKKVLE